jgi:acetyltransferase-like isoleucine patch superfamily enzyme
LVASTFAVFLGSFSSLYFDAKSDMEDRGGSAVTAGLTTSFISTSFFATGFGAAATLGAAVTVGAAVIVGAAVTVGAEITVGATGATVGATAMLE